MNRNKTLADRRAMLVLECALQRNLLRAQSSEIGWPKAEDWARTGNNVLTRLKTVPPYVLIGMAAALFLAPGKLAALARNGLTLWQLWRTVKPDAPTDPANPPL